jgi:hypothetical protein
MKLNELIKEVKDNNLIETISDIEFLFLNYSIDDKTLPIDKLIEDVIKWGYEKDELKDFYSEHLNSLINIGSVSPMVECCIDHETFGHSFSLFCFESKNHRYYKVVGSGLCHEIWDTDGFYEIINKHSDTDSSDTDIIAMFKDECHEAFTNYGEFSYSEKLSDGSTIEFYS